MLTITAGTGFQMVLNGYTVSVQFGGGNYCQHRHLGWQLPKQMWKSEDAEIAVWENSTNEWLRLGNGDDVAGWVSAEKVGKVIGIIASATSETTEELSQKCREVLEAS